MLASRGCIRSTSRTASLRLAARPIRRISYVRRKELLEVLQRNSELGDEDARNELRWIEAELPQLKDTRKEYTNSSLVELVERRGAGEPLQYLLGSTDFGPLSIRCRPPVLIPRPETAFIFERYATLIQAASPNRNLKVLDLCTGSGCIPLLLSYLLPDHLETLLGVDISGDAISLAQENSQVLGLPLEVLQSDLFDRDFGKLVRERIGDVDILVSNPPYISSEEYLQLPRGVREYEDPRALLDVGRGEEGDGLRFYRRIAELIPTLLRPYAPDEADGNWARDVPTVVLEIGHLQASSVSSILLRQSLGRVERTEVWQDQFGKDRAIAAWIS